jgi:hypothetical protein
VPLDALALALASAVVHALWNLLAAHAAQSQAALAVAMTAGALACAPVAALSWDVDAAVAPYVAASVAFELGYLALLGTAYQRAPMSVVYPVARGAAPVIVLVAGALALGVVPPAGAVAGVLAWRPACCSCAARASGPTRVVRGSASASPPASPATRSSTTPDSTTPRRCPTSRSCWGRARCCSSPPW